MSVNPSDVAHIAALARLRLDPDEADRMTRELNQILAHVDALASADSEEGAGVSVGPERAPRRLPGDLGPDALARGPAAFAPAWVDGLFTVPRLAAMEDERASGTAHPEERSPAGQAEAAEAPSPGRSEPHLDDDA